MGSWRTRVGVVAMGALATAGGLVAVAGSPAAAVTTTVTNTADDGTATSLREVIAAAASGDTIVLTAGATYSLNCDPGTGELRITVATLTIQSTSTTQNAIIEQTCVDRVMVAQFANTSLTLTNITLTGGFKPDGSGGGIKTNNTGGSLNLDGVAISDNQVANDGGGIDAHGALSMTNSTISGNCASDLGGAVVFHDGTSAVFIQNSTITGNTHGELEAGAITDTSGRDITLNYVTLVENTSSPGDPCNFVASTGQGPVDPEDADDPVVGSGDVGAQQTPIANLSMLRGSLTSFGTVIALPQGPVQGAFNCTLGTATVTSNGYNFEQGGLDATSCQLTGGAGDVQNGADPALGALGANGGPTQTRVPQTGSPLINVIPLSACAGPSANITRDQRNITRPQETGCEIGAVEIPSIPLVAAFTG